MQKVQQNMIVPFLRTATNEPLRRLRAIVKENFSFIVLMIFNFVILIVLSERKALLFNK
jgi:hypothetical protein